LAEKTGMDLADAYAFEKAKLVSARLAMVIDAKLAGDISRLFTPNIGHRISFVSCKRNFDWSEFRDSGCSRPVDF
jgi:hypothetical protein